MELIVTVLGMVLLSLFVFVAWILPMVLSYRMAKDYGRNKAAWVLLAFCFGWIPTIILLVVGKK